MKLTPLSILLILAASLDAQNAIPSGAVLPLQLDTTINAVKAKPGQRVLATVMQNVPDTAVHRGAHVLGHVVDVTPLRLGQPHH
jgi:hypothetical protein